MPRPGAVAVAIEELAARAAERGVGTLRARLASRAAREHPALDLLDGELEQARTALAALAGYVASVEAALSEEEPSQARLLALALGGGPLDRVERLRTALSGVRRRVAQVAARL